MTTQQATGKHPLDSLPKSILYASPEAPFAIGLKPLSEKDLLQLDGDFLRYRAEKQQLYDSDFEQICMAEPASLDAQQEATQLIVENLKNFHTERYRLEDRQAVCRQTEKTFRFNRDMPIAGTALLVPEDLVLMRRDTTGWRLVAASLCFPSSWNLAEKFSKPLESVHNPVPIPEKMDMRINRIFDNLQPSLPVWRSNWSFHGDNALRYDRTEEQNRKGCEKLDENAHFRSEFQTLHKLPQSGDILFTIRIKSRPVKSILQEDDGPLTLALMHRHVLAMSDEQRNYKGIKDNAAGLLAWLEQHGTE